MFEKFTGAGAGDFRQRYQGTYGFFTKADKKILSRLDSVNTDRARPILEFVDRDGMKYQLLADSKDNDVGFTFLIPKTSWHNSAEEGKALLVSRVPARQYQRGLCDRNTAFITPRGTKVDVNFESIQNIFDSKVSVQQAFDAAKAQQSPGTGVALSPYFCLDFYNKAVNCFHTTIGSFSLKDDNTVDVSLKDPEMWRQELVDAFRRNNLKAEVK